MDIVYVVGPGSLWQNNELRYSLRSVEKYLSGFDSIYIIGECPDWLTGVVKIPFENPGLNKEEKIYRKIMVACRNDLISANFLFMNDDHFILKPASVFVPFMFDGSLEELAAYRRNNDSYKRAIINTHDILKKNGLKTMNFDIHVPIVYNKKVFSETMANFDWSVPFGYVIKSLYCNANIFEGVFTPDCKIDSPVGIQDMRLMIKTKGFFSMGDWALEGSIRELMESLYPNPSRFEVSQNT